MNNITCPIHNNIIIIFEKEEEHLYSDKTDGTIIFYDSLGKKYLKKYKIGRCDEKCETIKNILKETNTATIKERESNEKT